jgi:co-chaperonin GroES (HSP10)
MATATKQGRGTAPRLRPLDDRGLVKQVEAEERTTGAIIFPDKDGNKAVGAKVRSVSPGELNPMAKRVPLTAKPGDRVIFEVQSFSGDRPVRKPLASAGPAQQDEVSLLQKTYRSIWAGILSEERIEEECRWIARLFRA